MKKFLLGLGWTLFLGVGCSHLVPPETVETFTFPSVQPEHEHMYQLLANAMGYLKPENGLVDPSSGYPVEGWNQDPERGIYLRSFTQLTAIGQRIELLANIAAGYADNPYLSREKALRQLSQIVTTLLADQNDPKISAKGLLGNFLGLEPDGRKGPLSEEVEKQKFIQTFGEEQALQIWNALMAKKWILPQQDGSFAKISRKGKYGDPFFTDELAPFAGSNTCATVMSVLDTRVVQIIFGDNANLTASAAKAIGALLQSTLKENLEAIALCDQLEEFIAKQEEGYRFLYDEEAGTFLFGWNATNDRLTGWEDSNGQWIVGHMDYVVNEFRGPLLFVVQRFNLSVDAIKNSRFKIKPYRMADGRDLYTLATWHGSAFQSLGLSLFMQELDSPGWRETLENSVAIHLDFSARHHLPGFLSEAYSGNGVEYTGEIGIPDIAVTDQLRITDAPSLYPLGIAYSIAPDPIETLLSNQWETIRLLLTDHGPWEGFNTTQHQIIPFQTAAHTLALLLGGLGSSEENMQRYLTWRGIPSLSEIHGKDSPPFDFLSESVEWIPWSPIGDSIETLRSPHAIQLRAKAVRNSATTIKPPNPIGLSNGALILRYRATEPIQAVIALTGGDSLVQNKIHVRFDRTESEKEIRIPLPAMLGLENIIELVMHFGREDTPKPIDLTLLDFRFVPL